jgi:hypothetical protein
VAVRISYRRSGGLAGIDMAADAAAHELSDDEIQLATQLLAHPPEPARKATAPKPDQFNYRLHVDDGAQQRTFEWSESEVPDHVRPLLSALHGRATPTRS